MFNRIIKKLGLMAMMTGLLFCEPVFSSSFPIWKIDKTFLGSGEDRKKGDIFRVIVRFKNRTTEPMLDVRAEIVYPGGVIPHPDRVYQDKFTKFPWDGHFIDEDHKVVVFQIAGEIKDAPQDFYCYFVAEKYGKFDFDYRISWSAKDGSRYSLDKNSFSFVFPDSAVTANLSDVSEKPLTAEVKTETTPMPRHIPLKTKGFSIGFHGGDLLIILVMGILIGALLSYVLVKRKVSLKPIIDKEELENMILSIENENEELRDRINEIIKSREGVA